MDKLNVQWTWMSVTGIENTCRNWHHRFHPQQRQTKIQKSNLCKSSTWHPTTKPIKSHNKPHCERESHILIRKSHQPHIRFNHDKTACAIKFQYMCMKVKSFCLENCMDRAENIIIQISMIPQGFIIAYNIKDNVHNGYIFAQVIKGKYWIPQAGRIEYDALV